MRACAGICACFLSPPVPRDALPSAKHAFFLILFKFRSSCRPFSADPGSNPSPCPYFFLHRPFRTSLSSRPVPITHFHVELLAEGEKEVKGEKKEEMVEEEVEGEAEKEEGRRTRRSCLSWCCEMQDPAVPSEDKETLRAAFCRLAAAVAHQFPTVPWVPVALALALYRRETALDSLKQKPSSAGDRERFQQVKGRTSGTIPLCTIMKWAPSFHKLSAGRVIPC